MGIGKYFQFFVWMEISGVYLYFFSNRIQDSHHSFINEKTFYVHSFYH